MKSRFDQLRQKESEAALSADLVQRALARNAQQLEAQQRVVESAKNEWELLLAKIKLSQIATDGKILRGEIAADSQFLFGQERARRMSVKWDFDALMKTKL
jgi:hypothetical protein